MKSPFGEQFSWRDLLRPGCVLGLAGLTLILVAIVRTWWSTPEDPLLMTNTGSSVKMMVWMVVGVGITLFGALLSYLDFTRR
jgi:hypothetical protein